MFEEALLCVRTFDAFVITRRRTARDLRDDIIVTSLSKHLSLSLPIAWQSLFREHNNALFEGSSSLSTFFLSAFLKTTRAREKDVYCVPLKVFRETKEPKSGFFVHTNNARVFRSPSEGAERRRTRARRVQSLSRNEKDAYFLSLFFFLECATENCCDGVNENKTTREDGSTTNNRRAGKERR